MKGKKIIPKIKIKFKSAWESRFGLKINSLEEKHEKKQQPREVEMK